MPRDPFVREKFTKERIAARKLAAEYFQRFPKERYRTPWGNMPIAGQLSVGGFGKKRFLAMSRVLPILALSALCLVPVRASADTLKPHESVASEISSRQRCACTWRRPGRIVHYKRYRSVRANYSYLFGFDPLPYRFGYFPEPYRYRYHAAMLTVRPYRYYR